MFICKFYLNREQDEFQLKKTQYANAVWRRRKNNCEFSRQCCSIRGSFSYLKNCLQIKILNSEHFSKLFPGPWLFLSHFQDVILPLAYIKNSCIIRMLCNARGVFLHFSKAIPLRSLSFYSWVLFLVVSTTLPGHHSDFIGTHTPTHT